MTLVKFLLLFLMKETISLKLLGCTILARNFNAYLGHTIRLQLICLRKKKKDIIAICACSSIPIVFWSSVVYGLVLNVNLGSSYPSNPTLHFLLCGFSVPFCFFRESEGSSQSSSFWKEVDDLRAVIQHFSGANRVISAILGHSKGRMYYLT